MGRVAYAFHIAPGQEADVAAAAADLRSAASDDYARTRAEFGLTSLGVWLQSTSQGSLVVCVFEGNLDEYFERARAESGIDEWFRDKIRQWTGSDEEMLAVYDYPQSEELFYWKLEA